MDAHNTAVASELLRAAQFRDGKILNSVFVSISTNKYTRTNVERETRSKAKM